VPAVVKLVLLLIIERTRDEHLHLRWKE